MWALICTVQASNLTLDTLVSTSKPLNTGSLIKVMTKSGAPEEESTA